MELRALADELERQRESRMDVIVPSTEIFAQPTVDDVNLNFTVPGEGGSQPQVMPLTDWAHSQVSAKLRKRRMARNLCINSATLSAG